ncbi:MAG: efflux RND transporter periplasmic adaptor subunit, partial [Sinobacteraceae bacterium]|nr:efflux RND transporter periplasmic adaptor subunit [Nevskiaceae bacterium]
MMLQRNKVAAGVVVAVALGLVGYGIWGRKHQLAALERVAVVQSAPSVEIITPRPGPAARPLVLPGTVRAWYEAPIFAQVSGYVRSWDKDYGATVKAGEVLAEIETP